MPGAETTSADAATATTATDPDLRRGTVQR